MTIMVVPRTALAPASPSVGIFWRVDGVLVVDRSTLEEAETYGDCITHAAGHHERWEAWQALGTARLAAMGFPDQVASTEYDQWPRGRIVYETPPRRFVLYADRRLQKPYIIHALNVNRHPIGLPTKHGRKSLIKMSVRAIGWGPDRRQSGPHPYAKMASHIKGLSHN